MPLDGRGEGVGLTPHNDSLAVIVSPITQTRREVETVRGKDGKRRAIVGDRGGHTLTCLALDLLIVSEIGFFFSFIALLEKSSTNSSKSTLGSTTFSHTNETMGLNEGRRHSLKASLFQ